MNVHQLFPTVNGYRGGQVSELKTELDPAIAETSVDTRNGIVSFDRFLSSAATTTLGMVIVHKGKIVFESYPLSLIHI